VILTKLVEPLKDTLVVEHMPTQESSKVSQTKCVQLTGHANSHAPWGFLREMAAFRIVIRMEDQALVSERYTVCFLHESIQFLISVPSRSWIQMLTISFCLLLNLMAEFFSSLLDERDWKLEIEILDRTWVSGTPSCARQKEQ
jgi:hypothetical protein